MFNFQMALTAALPPVVWPAGITVRSAVLGQDDEALHRLIQTAFERPGREPQSFGQWKASLMAFEGFDPTLWFVAVAGEEIVGACLCRTHPGEGWVRQLAVVSAWRGRGLGRAGP
ncbi:MAG: GNAT family N-acetyltransferase [Rhodobacteraceae bacterium]|nr:GNAT family N-acetyltransferase [Paracoccaceae bacterium]